MTGTAMLCEANADPEVTAERVRQMLESMGKYRNLLRTIAAAPRPVVTPEAGGLEVCRSGELVAIVRRRGGRLMGVQQVAGEN